MKRLKKLAFWTFLACVATAPLEISAFAPDYCDEPGTPNNEAAVATSSRAINYFFDNTARVSRTAGPGDLKLNVYFDIEMKESGMPDDQHWVFIENDGPWPLGYKEKKNYLVTVQQDKKVEAANFDAHRVDQPLHVNRTYCLRVWSRLEGGCRSNVPSSWQCATVQDVAETRTPDRIRMVVSNANSRLAMNAFGGARHGAVLKLVNSCTPTNPDCTWTYRNGMLLSNTNQTLAINAFGGARHGTVLKLVNSCTPTNPDCTWTYRNGMFLSNRDQTLAINAFGGARHGIVLKLVNSCTPTNPDCTWTWK